MSLPAHLEARVPSDEPGFLLQCLGLYPTMPKGRPSPSRSLQGPLLVSIGFECVSYPSENFVGRDLYDRMGVAILDTQDLTNAVTPDDVPVSTHVFSTGPRVYERQADSGDLWCMAHESLASDLSSLLPKTREIVLVGQELNMVKLYPLCFDWSAYDIAGVVRVNSVASEMMMPGSHRNTANLLHHLDCSHAGVSSAGTDAQGALRAALLLATRFFSSKPGVVVHGAVPPGRLALVEDVGYGEEEEEV
jgi:hypothetical protein